MIMQEELRPGSLAPYRKHFLAKLLEGVWRTHPWSRDRVVRLQAAAPSALALAAARRTGARAFFERAWRGLVNRVGRLFEVLF